MKYSNVEPYLRDGNGNPSSTRLFSYMLLVFFKWYNILMIPVLLLAVYILKEVPDGLTLLFGVSIVYVVLNALFGIMIFAPKQFSKIEEIRGLIEVAKTGRTVNEVTKRNNNTDNE